MQFFPLLLLVRGRHVPTTTRGGCGFRAFSPASFPRQILRARRRPWRPPTQRSWESMVQRRDGCPLSRAWRWRGGGHPRPNAAL